MIWSIIWQKMLPRLLFRYFLNLLPTVFFLWLRKVISINRLNSNNLPLIIRVLFIFPINLHSLLVNGFLFLSGYKKIVLIYIAYILGIPIFFINFFPSLCLTESYYPLCCNCLTINKIKIKFSKMYIILQLL